MSERVKESSAGSLPALGSGFSDKSRSMWCGLATCGLDGSLAGLGLGLEEPGEAESGGAFGGAHGRQLPR
jgi:hypothetical protein